MLTIELTTDAMAYCHRLVNNLHQRFITDFRNSIYCNTSHALDGFDCVNTCTRMMIGFSICVVFMHFDRFFYKQSEDLRLAFQTGHSL